MVNTKVLESQIAYWEKQLTGAPLVLELPADRPRPAVPTNTCATRRIKLPADLTASLRELSQREGSSLFLVLLASFQTLLARYSGQTDIAVGTPIAGNTLVIRNDLSGNPSFRDLLGRVQEVVLGACAHRDVSLDQLLQALKPERSPSCHPFFQAMFMLGSDATAVVCPGAPAPDLTLCMTETADGLTGDLTYSTDLFDGTTVSRMLGHFRNLTEAIAADPAQPVAKLPLLSEAERHQMLAEWNRSEPAPARLIHEVVAEQAARRPDALAAEYGPERLTYRDLDRRANQLARYLQRLGVGPEVKVGLCAERSADFLVGLLGTLKAGGAYVPLDPHYPAERLAYMLTDSQVAVLLTQAQLVADLPEHSAVVVCLDAGREAAARESDAPVDSGVGIHNLAYMIYTSGSTGRPKGVLVEHKGIFNMAQALARGFGITAETRMLQFASLSFDASIAEIFVTLTAGATLILEPRENLLPSPAFLQLLRDRCITMALLPPPVLAVLPAENLPDLTTVITGGEACSADAVARWAPGRRFVNVYGPTEVTVVTTFGLCSDGSRPPSIGRVMSGLQVYLLDSALQPVPVGVPGELYAGGIGVARGYHNRPDLTAERFIANPFGAGLLYKTGDLARYLPDGTIEFIGRTDHQVKIRGFRIELGEVEAAVAQHPAVTAAAVVAREDAPGMKRLVAYVVPAADRPVTAAGLRAFVQERLPEYMVPSAFVLLAAMPLSANGKVDRRALPAPDLGDLGVEADFAAPRTPVEEVLASIWAGLLGLSRVSTRHSFFELGGHSLLATRVLARIRDLFGVNLPLRAVFEAPTVAGLAARVESARSAAGGSDQAPPRVLAARNAGEPLPLSFAQQRLWFIDQLQPGSPTYNLPTALRLQGELNVTALEQALSEISRRHETLRTTFAPGAGGGEPVQVIHPAVPVALAVTDLQHLAAEERMQEAVRLAGAEAQRPFDLAAGPLFRASLIRLGAADHVLLLGMHHILSDAWSMGVFASELSALYTAFTAGQPSPLAELPVQYADFALWQRQWLQGERLQAQLAYWKEQLTGAPAVLELPTDRPRPAVQTFRGADLTFALPAALVGELKALSRREGVTLFMTLLAAFQTLLSRYAGQTDICVGTPVAGRSTVELEPLIGFFVNTLVLRTDLSGNPAFRELLGRVRQVALDAYAHQELPFEQVVEAVQPERNLSHSPLFQVAFALQNVPEERLALPGLSASRMETGQVSARFDLTLFITESADGLNGMIEYNPDLFDAATIRRMAGHFRNLLDAVAADAGRPVAGLPLMSAEEQQQVLVEWNQTRTDYPRHLSIPELFASQAALRPDDVAIVSAAGDGAPWTYGELDRKANQLAHYLRRLGIGPDGLVGICMERAPETVMAMLAILKAGGAYVPLDPAYPAERLAFMLADTGLPVLLTREPMLERLPAHGARVVCLDRDWSRIAQEDAGPPLSGVTPENLACVIYTSGSTGRPKGTALLHRGVVRLLVNTDYVQLGPATCMAQASNHSFDAATFEIWGALLHGGKLVMISKELALSPREFAAAIREQSINTLLLTTALFHQMAREVPDCFRTARYVLFGGEAADPRAVREVLRHGKPEHLINAYGPTESTTIATCHPVTAVAEGARSIPIGRPIANTTVYVLDSAMQALPIGIPGELYVGGDGLARGYLNRTDLTGEWFVPNPFGAGKLYRTGDQVRRLPDGSIEFLGRIDNQVKLRGFRIELGEIETVLTGNPGVREAVALVREDQPGFRRLVAYVVPAEAGAVAGPDLRSDMKERLPDYMVPAAFVLLDSLPLTPNGKVDRKALPAPEQGAWEPAAGSVAPRTPVEEAVASVWAQILGLPQVSVHANFFELGGHSLLATRVVSRLREVARVELPVRSLFEAPTVAGLAERVVAAMGAGQIQQAPPVRPRTAGSPVPASFAQQRLWFLDQMEPGSTAYNVPLTLRLQGQLNVGALEQALSAIIRRHDSLRTTFAMGEREPVQVIGEAEPVTLTAVDLRALPEGERENRATTLIAAEAGRPFDLAAGPLFRVALIRVADADGILLLSMHHIIADGWSLRVLHDELCALYGAFAGGQPAALPELAVQYPDFALWQRQGLRGEVLENQTAYWKQQLDGLATLQLPTDHPRPAVQTDHGALAQRALPAALAGALRSLSSREGVTLFMTLLAAFQTLLHRYTGQDDVVVGTPSAGRNRAEIEGLIGFFVNTLVLRTDLSGNPSFRALLRRVAEVTLGAYAHQDLPFEMVVDAVRPERDRSRSPLFQVMFILQNSAEQELKLPGLTVTAVDVARTTAKFDLSFVVTEDSTGLTAGVEYNTDLFDAATMNRLLGHFQTLLEGIVADADRPLAELPLLPEAERQHLLMDQNRTDAGYPTDRLVHEWIAAQAQQAPDAVAVVSGGQACTNGEVNRRANQLARFLQRQGVGPDVPVGLCTERTIDMIVGMLGVLKAGGAYLPMDPAYPRDRIAFMLEDAAVPVLLTQERFLPNLPDHAAARVICLDADWAAVAQESAEAPAHGARLESLAYVIYTSGSTGRPKGVQIEHRSLLNLVCWYQRTFGLTAADRITQTVGTAFDAAVSEIWPALASGAALWLCDEETRLSPAGLRDWLVGNRITVSTLPTPLAEPLLLQEWPARTALRCLQIGGDMLHHYPSPALPFAVVNNYGPTESTVVATSAVVPPLTDASVAPSIGRPIANTRVYILDRAMQPVPVGIPGELYISGDGLARGYLNRPDLTAERFLPNPFGEGRVYRTGDLGRWLPDGSIEFLGRTDNQVKLRGLRMELGEIEAVLANHPAVREAAVLVREDQPGLRRLVAYVVPAKAGAAAGADLRIYMKEQLPDYMVPAAFVLLEALPLTPHGKVDRRALPAPDRGAREPDAGYVAPHTPVEEAVASVWAQILGLPLISVHDNFFELGGHSLLATRVISRLRDVLRVELPVSSLFEAPTAAELAERVESAIWSGQGIQVPPVCPRQVASPVPASFAQQRLWFIDQMEPGSPVYNIPVALRLQGPLNVGALERALSEIIRRHESLRTTFAMGEREPVQIIGQAEPVTLTAVDLRALPGGERETRAMALIAAEAGRPFDLAAGPLFRVALIRVADADVILLLSMHHIIADGWSRSVLYDELAALYGAFAGGQPAALPEPTVQYADFALWQRKCLRGERLANQIAYWKQHLAGLATLQLLTDRPRPAVQTHHGAVVRLSLPAALADALRSLSRQEGVTLFMTLLAAFQTLLHRCTGQDDVAVGTPIAGRNRAEVEGIIGFFVNTLVLRTDLSGNPSFRTLLRRVAEVTLGAYAHQDLPFDMLVDAVQPERDRSRSPLVQVMFMFENRAGQELELPGLTVTAVETELTTAKFDLTLAVAEGGTGLTAALEYNTDLFDAATANRLLGHFQTLLEGIAADADQPLADLPLLSDAERQHLLAEQNRTDAGYPTDRLVHEWFAAHAQQAPDAVAVVSGGLPCTYAEVNRRANQMARFLQKQGVGPDVPVGLCTERTVDMIVGMLGVLKAGGAYVPMDPAYPRDRIAFMLEDAAVPVLLTQERLLPNLPEQATARVICLDADWAAVAEEAAEAPVHGARLESLAYVIYTSGSTGRPKGVQIEHRSLLNLVCWYQRTFGLTAADRVTQTVGTAFDAAVAEIWPALTCGAALYLPDEETRLSPARLRDWLVENRITVSTLPTPLAEPLLLQEWPAHTALRCLHTGGDKLRHYPSPALPFVLVNNYGPTESTVVATSTIVPPLPDAKAAPSIGRPIANTRVYILDRAMRPVPTGVPGELYIGGDGLARGYLHRPDLTAERFLLNPFGEGRVYRTGDLGRWLPDGSIDFLGRIDNQVKLRGFRIELGEIESVLEQHAGVRVGVVVAREDSPGRKYLAAYIVPAGTAGAPDTDELRRFLREQLPDHMVPAAFVTLERLPLTPNGKVDLRALPAPDLAASGSEYVAPRNETEGLLARIWGQVLGAERIGVHDNFFERGGNSLMAIQVVVRLRQQGYVATAQQLFEHQSIAELAERLEPVAPARTEAAPLPAPAARPVATAVAPASVTGAWKASMRPGHVLLTGATGYLGIYLLREILRDSEAVAYCLVRARDAEEGMRRISDQLRWYFPDEPDLICARIRPVPGDLRAPHLGVAPDPYRHLCEHVEAIFHAAADVRHVGTKEQFQAANVAGTEALIALAQTGRPKVLHFVSTLSVCGEVCPDPSIATFSEHDFHIGQRLEGNHYPHSKYLAEAAVRDAMAGGCQAVIYRTGFLAADSVTGRFQKNAAESATYRMLRGIIHTGVSPYLPELMVDFTPVDFIARAIFTLSRTPEAFGQTFHLVSPHRQSLYDVVRTFQTFGYGIRLMPPDRYAAEVFRMSDDAGFLSELGGLTMFAEDQGPVPTLRIDSSFTQQRLTRLGLEYPQPTLAWWQLVLKHVIEVGFARPPVHWGKTWSVPDSGWR